MINESMTQDQCHYGNSSTGGASDNMNVTTESTSIPGIAGKNCSGDLLNAGNGQYDIMYCEPIQSAPLALVSGLVATAIIVGNLLVIVAILRGSSRFHRPMYWLIIHLSCADLLVGIMLLWNYCLASLLDIHNTITSLMVIFSIWVASVSSSTIGFVLLAIDRYVQIFYKSFHRTYATRMTVGFAIFIAWCFPICFYCVPPLAFDWSCKDACRCTQKEYMECPPVEECSQILPPFTKSYSLCVAILLFFFLPLPVCIYSMIFIQVRRKTHVVKHTRRRHDMRLIKTLVVILAVFIITLSPVGVVLVFDFKTNVRDDTLIDWALYLFVLAFLNSLANPLLYIWRMVAIRRSIRQRLLFCCFWKKSNGQSSRRDITSYQSDQRSPSVQRQNNNANEEEQKFLHQNNNIPLAAVLCLRQIKRGRYSNSRTSTPLSERSNNKNHEEMKHLQGDEVKDAVSIPMISDIESCAHKCIERDDPEITEL